MLETILPHFRRLMYYDTLCKAQTLFNEEQFSEYICNATTQYSGAIITNFGTSEKLLVHDTEGCVLEVIPEYNHGLFWWKQVAVRLEPEEEGANLSGLASEIARFIEQATGFQTSSSNRFIYIMSLVKPRTIRRYSRLINHLDLFDEKVQTYVKPLMNMYIEKSKDTQSLIEEHQEPET